MNIVFIGGGNMGEAMLAAVLQHHLAIPDDVTVSDIVDLRLQYLKEKYKIHISRDNAAAITGADFIIIAVKPQILPQIITDYKNAIKPGQLVLSIVAGVKIATLQSGLGHSAIIRTMPNTPVQIGEGMTVWTATREVTIAQKKQAEQILNAMGKQIYVEDEKYLDMATAVSGSGPAYLFYFLEALIDAAVELGFSRDDARLLAMQTVKGAVDLLSQSGQEASELRRAVTSPGGTTAAAIKTMEEGQFKELVNRAVKAAHARAMELGK